MPDLIGVSDSVKPAAAVNRTYRGYRLRRDIAAAVAEVDDPIAGDDSAPSKIKHQYVFVGACGAFCWASVGIGVLMANVGLFAVIAVLRT